MGQPAADRAALGERWSRLHHGLRPSPPVRRWLGVMWTLAGPLSWMPPLAITAAGAVLAVDAVLFAERLPLVALALVVLAALCDGLDGAVAVVTGRSTRAGALADAVADRIADGAFALVIWRCGAPLGLAVLAGGLSLVHEGARAVAPRLRTTVTVAERPTRVICTVLACASAAAGDWAPTVCAAVWAGLAVAGLVQLIRSARSRSARRRPPPSRGFPDRPAGG